MKKEDFEDIIFGEQVVFRKKNQNYKKDDERTDILIEFIHSPYDILIEKIKGRIKEKQSEEYPDKVFMRYKDTGDSWELGYIKMDLKFWKFIEDIFYNYKPEFYRIKKDKLEIIEKGELLQGEKFFGGDLDGYVE